MSASCRSGSVAGSACTTTGRAATIPREGHQSPFATLQRLAELRSETGHRPVSVCSGKPEASLPGRPLRVESEARAVLFVACVADGFGLRAAAKQAGVKADRALDLADQPDFWLRVFEQRRRQAA